MKRSTMALGGLAVLLVMGALLGARPAYRQLKDWRAHAHVREAERLVQERRFEEAIARGQSALQLSPNNPTAIRFLANLLAGLRHPQAIPFLERVLSLPDASDADRLQLVTVGLTLRRFEVVERQLEVALRGTAGEPSVALLRLAARHELMRGRREEAVRLALRALERAPEDRTSQLQLAQIQVLSPWPEEVREGRERLWGLAGGGDDAAVEALDLLAQQKDLRPPDLERLFALLRADPTPSRRKALIAGDIELRLAPERRPTIIDAVVAAHADADAAGRLELGRWLNRHGEFNRTLALLDAVTVAGSREALLVRLDALAGTGQWTTLRQELASPGLALEPALAALFQARVAGELGETRIAELYWDQALSQAAKDPAQLWYIAEYAQKCRQPAVATRAYRRIIADGRAAKPAYVALLRIVEAGRDTRAVRDLMREMAARFPEDLEPRNDLAYLDLLLGENIPQAATTAAQLASAHPSLPAVLTTHALALLRTGQAAAATQLYEESPLAWDHALPAWQAVWLAVHAAAGRQLPEVRARALTIATNTLRVEEHALIDGLVQAP